MSIELKFEWNKYNEKYKQPMTQEIKCLEKFWNIDFRIDKFEIEYSSLP